MKMHVLQFKQQLPIDQATAWAFFSNPWNLSKITPPKMKFRVTNSPTEQIYAGMMISYSVTPLLGIPTTWISEITHVRQGEYFVDEQRAGPFKLWHHEHHFRSIPNGIEIEDTVSYMMPFGPIGEVVRALRVRGELEQIFTHRTQVLEQLFPHARG